MKFETIEQKIAPSVYYELRVHLTQAESEAIWKHAIKAIGDTGDLNSGIPSRIIFLLGRNGQLTLQGEVVIDP